MNIIGVDYGRKKTGIAVAQYPNGIPAPVEVIKTADNDDLVSKIKNIVQRESAGRIVVGCSEGVMAKETEIFAKTLEKKIGVLVHLQDETLTTNDAIKLSIQAGIGRKKRKSFEDAYAACIILENYISANI